MEKATNTKAEIISLLEHRSREGLEKIRQFILDLGRTGPDREEAGAPRAER